jgi:DNA-binding GntR family transcriptional regulator
MENWIVDTIPDLTPAVLEAHGLYGLLRRAGVNLRVASQSIGATTTDAKQSGLLGVSPGSALVTMQRTASDDTGRAIETGRHLYRADSYTFDMTLVQR